MTDEEEGRYFAECERRERAMSRRTADPRAALAHEEMADRYEAMAIVFGAKHPDEVPADYRHLRDLLHIAPRWPSEAAFRR